MGYHISIETSMKGDQLNKETSVTSPDLANQVRLRAYSDGRIKTHRPFYLRGRFQTFYQLDCNAPESLPNELDLR